MRVSSPFRLAAAAAVALVLLVGAPMVASARPSAAHKACKTSKTTRAAHARATSSSNPDSTFGISGGNILPWTIEVDNSGAVTSTSWVKAHNTQLADPAGTLDALFKLADAEGFFSMPANTRCPGVLPDI